MEHSGMCLREEHIACMKVNWNRKSDNIEDIVEELNIGLENMVFVDDSLYEIEEVKAVLPEVTSVLFNPERIYEDLMCFHLQEKGDAETVARRTNTYQTNEKRRELREQCDDYQEFLRNLNTKKEIHEAQPNEYQRISELSQRTNRCTNGRRYQVMELKEEIRNGLRLYAVYLSDRFSDLGLIGAFGILENYLKLFCVSCRALGKEVEEEMIAVIKDMGVNGYQCSTTRKNADLIERFRTEAWNRIVSFDI